MEFLEYTVSLPSLGVAGLLMILNIIRIIKIHNRNNINEAAENYVSQENFKVLRKDEKYIRTYETKVRISNSKKEASSN